MRHTEMDRLFNEVFQGAGVARQTARYGPDAGLAYAPVRVPTVPRSQPRRIPVTVEQGAG